MTALLLATRNRGKKRELEHFLSAAGVSLRLLSLADVVAGDDIEETGRTFAENARLKADHYSRVTGLDTLGDDSGLEVAALGGRPGVLSARYAGPGAADEARIAKLLDEMREIVDRSARFVSAVCISRAGAALAQFIGTVEGRILHEKRGGGGFGYDPLFFYPPLGRTFAELPLEEKNRISHRARALEQVREFIRRGGLEERPLV
jgi:XTP/dITP diphosphohydrolase